jgi:dTDP-4-amino-4,6-dideoxygalactose transaminase
VVRVNDREALRSGLSERNIGSAVYYPEPLHLQPCFSDLGYGPGDLPHAEEACADVLALPCFPGLTDEEQTTIARTIADFYQT